MRQTFSHFRSGSSSGLMSIVLVAVAVCSAPAFAEDSNEDVLYQVSTIDALMQSVYDGVITFGELKQHGDFGIGTFEGIDGEMIALDGDYLQVRADGVAYLVDDSSTTPFSTVTYFEKDLARNVTAGNLTELGLAIDEILPSKNLFYAIRIDGTFSYVKTRSIAKQFRPYRPLANLTENQSVFEFRSVNGTIVGFYTPEYAKGLNVPGYHLHLITADRTSGGHILDLSLNNSEVQLDITDEFDMVLPTSGDFIGVDLTKDMQKALKKVEG